MNQNKENLIKLLKFIQEISEVPENDWFKIELLKTIDSTAKKPSENSNLLEIKRETEKISKYLAINPECSINYNYIKHNLLKTRLELDNLRMENVRYNMDEKDEMKRIYDFSINAFYQIENLINYYFFEIYPNINDLLSHLENVKESTFRRNNKERSVGDIRIAVKIFCFTKVNYNQEEMLESINIENLNKIRNEGLHRCSIIKKHSTEETKYLHKFLQVATFDSVHSLVNSLNHKIKTLLENKTLIPPPKPATIDDLVNKYKK